MTKFYIRQEWKSGVQAETVKNAILQMRDRYYAVLHLLIFALWASRSLEKFRVIALEFGHECDAHAPGKEEIFAVNLLAARPVEIAKSVNIGRPKIKVPAFTTVNVHEEANRAIWIAFHSPAHNFDRGMDRADG